MSHSPQDILETIIERLRKLASTETVIGEPVTVGDVTILPVIRVSVGFAAGGGEGMGTSDKSDKSSGEGRGGGGGGGASISPVGFIVYDGQKVQFVNVSKGKIDSLIDTVPELLNKLGISKGKRRGGDKSSASDTAES